MERKNIFRTVATGLVLLGAGFDAGLIVDSKARDQQLVSKDASTPTINPLSRAEIADALISAPLGAEKRRNYIQAISVLHSVVEEFVNPQVAEKAGIGESFFQNIITSDDETLANFIKTRSDLGQEGFAFFGRQQTWYRLGNKDIGINNIDILTTAAPYNPKEQFKISPDVISAKINIWMNPQTMPDVTGTYSDTAQKAALAFNIFNLPNKVYWFPISRVFARGQEVDKGIRGMHIDESSGRLITVDVGSHVVFYLSVSYPSTINFPR